MNKILTVIPDDIQTDSVRAQAKNHLDEIALIDLRQEVFEKAIQSETVILVSNNQQVILKDPNFTKFTGIPEIDDQPEIRSTVSRVLREFSPDKLEPVFCGDEHDVLSKFRNFMAAFPSGCRFEANHRDWDDSFDVLVIVTEVETDRELRVRLLKQRKAHREAENEKSRKIKKLKELAKEFPDIVQTLVDRRD